MNILKFFPKSRKKSIESLQFFYFLIDIRNYLFPKYHESKNPFIVNALKVFNYCYSYQLDQITDYVGSLRDHIFWSSREHYRENLQKFVIYELSTSKFINQVLDQILADKREARYLETNFYEQAEIELDPKNFQFSKILLNIQLHLEDFDDNLESDETSGRLREDELREIIKLALKDMKKYFSN